MTVAERERERAVASDIAIQTRQIRATEVGRRGEEEKRKFRERERGARANSEVPAMTIYSCNQS